MLDQPQFRDIIRNIYLHLQQTDQWNLSRTAKALRGEYTKLRDSSKFCMHISYAQCGKHNHQICLTRADLLGRRQNHTPMEQELNYVFLGAIHGGHTALVRKLLERGNPTAIDRGLYYASIYGHKMIAMLLLARLRNNNGNTLHNTAAEDMRQTIDNAFLAAAATGHLAIVEMMLKNGASSIVGGIFAACTGIAPSVAFYTPRPYEFGAEHKKIVTLLAGKCIAAQIRLMFLDACDGNGVITVQNMLESGIVERATAIEGANRATHIARDNIYAVIAAHLRKK